MLTPGQPGAKIVADDKALSWDGVMPNGLKHACGLRVLHSGGSVKADGDSIIFTGCDSLTLLLDARTDYAPDFKANWRGKAPGPVIAKELAAAESKSFEALRKAHLADLARLLARVRVNWGQSNAATLKMPTDARLAAYGKGAQRSRPGSDDVPIWPLSPGQLLATGRSAGQFAGALER